MKAAPASAKKASPKAKVKAAKPVAAAAVTPKEKATAAKAASAAKAAAPTPKSQVAQAKAAAAAAAAAAELAAAAAKRSKAASAKKKTAVKAAAEDIEEEEGRGGGGASAPSKGRKAKVLKPMESLEVARMAFKWWEAPVLPKGLKWHTMEHAGVFFPPAYVPHGIALLYDGVPVVLTPAQEEAATFYAAISPEAQQLKDPHYARVFNANFWEDKRKEGSSALGEKLDFKRILGEGHVIKDLARCNFSLIRAHLARASEARKNAAKEVKERLKAEKEAKELTTGFALVDGHVEKVGNVTVEPPGLFRGRGAHPLMGLIKRRVAPEEITINIAPGAPVPPCPLPGHSWKRVVHDPSITWLAFWTDPIGGNHKYVYLAASSSFKGSADRDKYDKARRLKIEIPRIRAHYEKQLHSSESFDRQCGTALWIIDRLALRVGGEKDGDEADTVGCCSLRVEHISFPSETSIRLKFLGKDSMEYDETIDFVRHGPVGARVLHNLRKLTKDKPMDGDGVWPDVFDMLKPDLLNDVLNKLMPGLSAKVFRTYNASVTLQAELEILSPDTPLTEKVSEYNRANREVAILCNHQKTVSAGVLKNLGGIKDRVDTLRTQLAALRAARTREGGGGGKKGEALPTKRDADAIEADADKRGTAIAKEEAIDKARKLAGGDAAGMAAAATAEPKAEDLAKIIIIEQKKLMFAEAHLFDKAPNADMLDTRIKKWEESLEKLEASYRDKDDNKAVALGES